MSYCRLPCTPASANTTLCSWLVLHPPAGRLFNTLFGTQGQQQQGSPSGTSPTSEITSEISPHAFSEGSQRHAHAGIAAQHVADSEGQQLHSTPREEEGVLEDVGHSQRESDQGSYHRPSQPAAAEQQSSEGNYPVQGQRLRKAPPAEANAETDKEADRAAEEVADKSVAETEAALAGAQEAQQQAVQDGQEALAEEQQSLMQLRQDLQQQSGQPAQDATGLHIAIVKALFYLSCAFPIVMSSQVMRLAPEPVIRSCLANHAASCGNQQQKQTTETLKPTSHHSCVQASWLRQRIFLSQCQL